MIEEQYFKLPPLIVYIHFYFIGVFVVVNWFYIFIPIISLFFLDLMFRIEPKQKSLNNWSNKK